MASASSVDSPSTASAMIRATAGLLGAGGRGGGDDGRLEQPFADRLAQEEKARLPLDRGLDSGRPQELGARGARRDDDGVGEPRLERVDGTDPNVESAGECL